LVVRFHILSHIYSPSRKASLKALLESFEQNLQYLKQITDLHLPNQQLPSYPLDTVALAQFTFSAIPYLPADTTWPQRYNKLRFELDHLNRKILMLYIDLATTTCGGIPPETSSPSPSPHPSLANFQGVIQLIASSQKLLESEIEVLKKFA
jgi:hypothetical protein